MKKQFLVIFLMVFTVLSFGKNTIFAEGVRSDMNSSDKTLIIYFSLTSKTEKLAKTIQKESIADCYKISLVDFYLPFLSTLFLPNSQKKEEIPNKNCLLELENLSPYSVVYLGFPIWFNDMPFFMYKFLSQYDFAGKEVRVFATAGSSSFGNIIDNVSRALPNADIREPLLVNNKNKKTYEENAKEWLKSLTDSQ